MKKILYLLTACLITATALPQTGKRERADELYNRMSYMEAATLYERLAEKGKADAEVITRLGDAYYLNAQYDEAVRWYDDLFSNYGSERPVHAFRYSQTLKAAGRRREADSMLQVYNRQTQTEHFTAYLERGYRATGLFGEGEPEVTLVPAGINSPESDFGTALYQGKLVFASNRELAGSSRSRHQWTNRSFTNLFAADSSETGQFERPSEFLKDINSRFNESTPAFSPDGNTVYFTRNNFAEGKKGTDLRGNVLLKIYRSAWTGEDWEPAEELPINNDMYNCAHPALSPDGKTMYFASDRPGGYGRSDLYRVEIREDGSLGEPENLGPEINTPGRETFPFAAADGRLYFASDGHTGMGGLDIFCAPFPAEGNKDPLYNLGNPFNSPWDDFAFYLGPEGRSGFLSSNREGGAGGDDIYRFRISMASTPPSPPEVPEIRTVVLTGTVTDSINGRPIAAALIELKYADPAGTMAGTSTDSLGNYRLELIEPKSFSLRAEADTHQPRSLSRQLDSTESGMDSLRLDIRLNPVQDAKKLARINEIYFDFDDHQIRGDAARELDKVVRLMLIDYPDMTIRIESHTDPRGSHKYNDRLSQLRAASTFRYLVSQGVPGKRILSFRGFGKRNPINDCDTRSDCTEEEYGLNRRTEMPIVRISKEVSFGE